MAAFAGESQARNKYTYYASKAKKDGYVQIAQIFEETAGEDTTIMVPAITGTGKFAVKTPDVDIKINPDRLDLIETRIIEGRRCLVIAVEDNVEVNGMSVKMWEEKNHE